MGVSIMISKKILSLLILLVLAQNIHSENYILRNGLFGLGACLGIFGIYKGTKFLYDIYQCSQYARKYNEFLGVRENLQKNFNVTINLNLDSINTYENLCQAFENEINKLERIRQEAKRFNVDLIDYIDADGNIDKIKPKFIRIFQRNHYKGYRCI